MSLRTDASLGLRLGFHESISPSIPMKPVNSGANLSDILVHVGCDNKMASAVWCVNREVYCLVELGARVQSSWHQRTWCLWAPPLVHRWCLFTVFSDRDSQLSGASIGAAGVSFTGVGHPDLITFERPHLLMLSDWRSSFIVWNLVGNIPTTVGGHSCPFCYCRICT